MDAKKCDRCGSFYCDFDYCTDLCPKCMNDLKMFMEENKGES